MKTKSSKALKEVWEMKLAAFEQTKHLSGAAYFKYIHERVAGMIPGVEYQRANEHPAAVVAESRAIYRSRKK